MEIGAGRGMQEQEKNIRHDVIWQLQYLSTTGTIHPEFVNNITIGSYLLIFLPNYSAARQYITPIVLISWCIDFSDL